MLRRWWREWRDRFDDRPCWRVVYSENCCSLRMRYAVARELAATTNGRIVHDTFPRKARDEAAER